MLCAASSFAQFDWELNFDPFTSYSDRILIDTISNPNCIWQIGKPNKAVFSSAHSIPNAIVTDTLNTVPANDTSVFYLKHVRDNGPLPYHLFKLRFWYQMQGDSTDFGTIEISPDTGQTWINVLTQDTAFQMNWLSLKPTLNGSTNGWQLFDLNMETWASANNIGFPNFPIYLTADTILFRFTYITDSSAAPYDGWMIDDFALADVWEGIEEINNDDLISVFPNPASNELFIQQKIKTNKQSIQVFDYAGRIVMEKVDFSNQSIDTKQLQNGVYFLKYTTTKNYTVKKFIVQH